jgi:hypothetical protein
MEAGFLLELAANSAFSATKWVAGVPEKSFWTGLKIDGRAKLNVVTNRCQQCDFLESYAPA